jgi:hypothetical protein
MACDCDPTRVRDERLPSRGELRWALVGSNVPFSWPVS